MEATINGIFPTPIYISKIDRKFTPLELKFVDKNKKDFYKNDGNITSNNNSSDVNCLSIFEMYIGVGNILLIIASTFASFFILLY